MYREAFCNVFEIAKYRYEVPGRDWDEEGLSSYYVEEGFPDFEDSTFFELCDLAEDLEVNIDFNIGKSDLPQHTRNALPETVCKAFLDKYNSLEGDSKKNFNEEVKDYINTYIEDVVNAEI